MKNISIGSKIGNKGTIENLQFIDLFNYRYIMNNEAYTLDEIQEMLIPDKTRLFERMIMLLELNSKVVFKFLEKKTIDTRSLPKINKLNDVIQEIWGVIEDLDYVDYEAKESLITLFKKFWYILNN